MRAWGWNVLLESTAMQVNTDSPDNRLTVHMKSGRNWKLKERKGTAEEWRENFSLLYEGYTYIAHDTAYEIWIYFEYEQIKHYGSLFPPLNMNKKGNFDFNLNSDFFPSQFQVDILQFFDINTILRHKVSIACFHHWKKVIATLYLIILTLKLTIASLYHVIQRKKVRIARCKLTIER